MTEAEARDALTRLIGTRVDGKVDMINRAIQTAKQIGSSWPAGNINLIHIDYTNDHDFWRIVVE
jgi:hypothetical protein